MHFDSRVKRFSSALFNPSGTSVAHDLAIAQLPDFGGRIITKALIENIFGVWARAAPTAGGPVWPTGWQSHSGNASSKVRSPVRGAWTRTAIFPGLCSFLSIFM